MVAAFLITLKLLLKYIGEKEETKDCKHDEKLNQDDTPEFFTPGHGLETIQIKPVYPLKHDLNLAKKYIPQKGIQKYLFLLVLNRWIFYIQTLGNPSNSTDICYYT